MLERNVRLVNNSSGLVAFMYGKSNGTAYTIKKACAKPWKGGYIFQK
ncbi:MAG: hypothetical protein ABIH39_01110 [Candidatus Margulisiibacteriota bacterium]